MNLQVRAFLMSLEHKDNTPKRGLLETVCICHKCGDELSRRTKVPNSFELNYPSVKTYPEPFETDTTAIRWYHLILHYCPNCQLNKTHLGDNRLKALETFWTNHYARFPKPQPKPPQPKPPQPKAELVWPPYDDCDFNDVDLPF